MLCVGLFWVDMRFFRCVYPLSQIGPKNLNSGLSHQPGFWSIQAGCQWWIQPQRQQLPSCVTNRGVNWDKWQKPTQCTTVNLLLWDCQGNLMPSACCSISSLCRKPCGGGHNSGWSALFLFLYGITRAVGESCLLGSIEAIPRLNGNMKTLALPSKAKGFPSQGPSRQFPDQQNHGQACRHPNSITAASQHAPLSTLDMVASKKKSLLNN